MEENENLKLDVDTLNIISFERSKNWGAFFERFENLDENVEIPIDELDAHLQANEVWEPGNEAEEIPTSEDEIMKNCIETKGDIQNATACSAVDNDKELQEALNSTMPVLAEHKRQCQEDGIYRILNTFDPQKIDKKVGDWLRRNKSFNSTQNSVPIVRSLKASTQAHKRQPYISRIDSESENDSLESMDTARYILSSRQRGACPSRCDPSCGIKSYRMLQSKRNLMRERYTVGNNHSDELHLEALRYRRAHRQSKYIMQQGKIEECTLQQSAARRRHFHKRRSAAAGSSTESSGSEDLDRKWRKRRSALQSQRNKNSSRCTINPRDLRYRSLHYVRSLHGYKCKLHHSLSTSSSFLSHSSDHSFRIRRHIYKEFDPRPLKSESDCRCCNEKKLCELNRHLADSSAEKWMVDNCDTPRKQQDVLHALKFDNLQIVTPQRQVAKNAILENTERKRNTKCLAQTVKPTVTQSQQKVVDLCSTSECSNLVDFDLETPERRRKQVSKSRISKKPAIKKKVVSAKEKSQKITKRNNMKSETFQTHYVRGQAEKVIDAFQDATALHEQSSVQFANDNASKPAIDQKRMAEITIDLAAASDEYISPEISLKPQPKSAKLRKLAKFAMERSKNADNNEVFFTNTHKLRNSTAHANNTAITRQLNCDGMAAPLATTTPTRKRATTTTTSSANRMRSSSSSSDACGHTQIHCRERECMIVSSTTGDQLQNSTVPQQTEKGILLYTPKHKSHVPANSFVDGYFNITEEHLSSVIGDRKAQKFMKYYIGQRRFDISSNIYYQPPANCSNISHMTEESDIDTFDLIEQCGRLHQSVDKE